MGYLSRMHTISAVLVELSTTIVAAIAGLVLYSRLNAFHKLIFVQVVVYLVADVCAWCIGYGNHWVYNAYMLVETGILIFVAATIFTSLFARYFLTGMFVVFLMVYCVDVLYATGFTVFAHHAAIAQGVLLGMCMLCIVFHTFMYTKKWSVGIAVLGMALYFICTVPYLSAMYYFQHGHSVLNSALFRQIVVCLAFVRYLCVAAGFIWFALKEYKLKAV